MRSTATRLLLAAVLAFGLAAVPSGVAAAQEAISSEDIAVRDGLIAAQENLLNSYRCLFGVDVDLVPGGCPNPDVVSPGSAPESPIQRDLDVRDRLILSQEALLNVYRCRFDVDTQLVPDGCEYGIPAGTITIRLHHCMPGAVSYPHEVWTAIPGLTQPLPEGELQRLADLANVHLTPFFLWESRGRAVVRFEAGAEVLATFPQPDATLFDIAYMRNTPGPTSDNCANRVLNANGGWTFLSSEPYIVKSHWVTLVRQSLLTQGYDGLSAWSQNSDRWGEGPAQVAYQDQDHFEGEPFPLVVVAREVAHMLWGMQPVNQTSCTIPNSLLDAGRGLSPCPGVERDPDLAMLSIDCRNRRLAD